MTESDGIEEAFAGILRTAVMAGSQIATQLARRHELQLQQQQIRDQHQAKLLADRLEAEKRTALAGLAQVYRGEWWDHADQQRIGETLATAMAWSSEDPAAAQAERRMRDEIQARYNVEPATLFAQVQAETDRQSRTEEFAAAALTAQAIQEAQAWRTVSGDIGQTPDLSPADEPAPQAQTPRAASETDRREIGDEARRLSRDFTERLRVTQDEAALAGLSTGEYLGLLQPRHYQDVAAAHLYRDRGLEVTSSEQLWDDWRMEQALSGTAQRPLPVVVTARDHAPERAPYAAELLAAAASEAARADMTVETYLDHLEVGHHQQLTRIARDPSAARTYDGLPELSKRRVAYAVESKIQGRPTPLREPGTPEPSVQEPLRGDAAPSPRYDSAERRGVEAQELLSRGVPSDAVAARFRADTGTARPATDAPSGASRRPPQARRARSSGQVGNLARRGMER